MRRTLAGVLGILLLITLGCKGRPDAQPPVAKIVPKQLEKHGSVRTDNYFWLRERDNPEVRQYLEAENKYTQAMMARTQGL